MNPFSLIISRPPTVVPPTVVSLPLRRRLTSLYQYGRSDSVRFCTKIFASGGDEKPIWREFELMKKMTRFRDALLGFSKSENPVEYWAKHFEEYSDEIMLLVATAVLIRKLDKAARDLAGHDAGGMRNFNFDFWSLEENGEGKEEKADDKNDFGEDEKEP